MSFAPTQSPAPGQMIVTPRGQSIEFRLEIDQSVPGRAFLRTNLGRATLRREEIVDEVERGIARRKSDWRDLPMEEVSPGVHEVSVPLDEVGRFLAKAFFEPNDGAALIWPEGDDVVVKVEPADTVCANTMYSAFVRQFGESKSLEKTKNLAPGIAELDEAGYAVIPPSGKFRDVIEDLDHIIGELGFRIIQVLPVFPVPTTYARMGRFGSPFAALDFSEVDPALAEFDRRTTPLDQFRELTDGVHARGAKLFIDIPINHTGWASWLQTHHPEWFVRDGHERFQSPGAWGVTWEDLSELNYEERGLWCYIADVFLFWCRQGVDGFRCDAGYMVPERVWRYIVAKVRCEFPDTIFFLEGLGGPLQTVEALLDRANINWAYSEIFQTEGRDELAWKLEEWTAGSQRRGLEIHFAETHDNNRLAVRGEVYSSLRVALSAMASINGGYGITAGVEWFAKEKILVHDAVPLNWGADNNQVTWVRRINALLRTHVAFSDGARVELVGVGDGEQFGILRENAGESILALVNLDLENSVEAHWAPDVFSAGECVDLLDGSSVSGGRVELMPAQVRCLSASNESLVRLEGELARGFLSEPSAAHAQRLAALASDVSRWFGRRPTTDLLEAPEQFCAQAAGMSVCPMARWDWDRDASRVVVVPDGWGMIVRARTPFTVVVSEPQSGATVHKSRSFHQHADGEFALLPPFGEPGDYEISVVRYRQGSAERKTGSILAASCLAEALVDLEGGGGEYALCTNGRGAMSYVRGAWGEVRSQYDALLAANLHDDYPVDRRVMLVRCRAWVVYRDYSRELNLDCQTGFRMAGENTVEWRFDVPVGGGEQVTFRVRSQLVSGENRVRLRFGREEPDTHGLDADAAVRLIVRPDIDDRGFHEKTKAYAGPEDQWAGACDIRGDGFRFSPYGHALEMGCRDGQFVDEPEWIYNVAHPVDASRGLGAESDLFSPGYFELSLAEGDGLELEAAATMSGSAQLDFGWDTGESAAKLSLADASELAIRDFVVKRDDTRTVIAGYPWFLDWGRDTLICVRGMIAAGMLDESLDILKQFAQFERGGTLPNMIRGGDDSNRDTSDAPLWLFVGVKDLVAELGESVVLGVNVDGRTVAEVLISIGTSYRDGTSNGIAMDASSGLIFSPSHFTWMDTNHPAGTPRVGYPIEIQALWSSALDLLQSIQPSEGWGELAEQVRGSIVRYFWNSGRRGYLSDCLHAEPGQAAADATADDHLRPNQLFALTLGAVDDKQIAREVLNACEGLLVPGGVRSLADQPVEHPLPVSRDGELLNDPGAPYWGRYEGDEDTCRKPGYHNGTVWNWPFPSYAEALYLTYGDEVLGAARSILASAVVPFNEGCLGQLPEVMDGDAPHTERGCGAQAWSVTELYRVLKLLG